jgi:DNA damage-binding protein 2
MLRPALPRLAVCCPPPPPLQVDCAILKLHSRRVTTLAFPPDSDRLVVAGDKKGGVGIWNFEEVRGD